MSLPKSIGSTRQSTAERERMKHLILHIGQPKTGSTALQNFLQGHHDRLARQGYASYQPRYGYKGSLFTASGAFLLHETLCHLQGDIYGEEKKLLEETSKFTDFAHSHPCILLSDEWFYELAPEHPDFWNCVRETLYTLLGEESEIRIILYLRRQDEWLLSWWKQRLHTTIARESAVSFPAFLSNLLSEDRLDYDLQLKRLEEVFGRDHISVRVYDRAAFTGGDVCHDFLAALGIPWQEDFILPEKDSNPSLTLDAAQALYLIRSGEVSCTADEGALQNAALLFSSMYPEKRPFYPISEEDRRSLLEDFQEGNRRVEARYHLDSPIIRDAARAFETRLPDPERDRKNAELIVKLTTAPSGAARYLSERLTN